MEPAKCVKCGEPMIRSYGTEQFAAPFCENEDCALRGVLQTGESPKVIEEDTIEIDDEKTSDNSEDSGDSAD